MKDLGKASKTKNADGKEVLEVSLPTRPEDIDELWSGMRQELATPHVQEKSKRSADTKQADHYATVRTNTVCCDSYLAPNPLTRAENLMLSRTASRPLSSGLNLCPLSHSAR